MDLGSALLAVGGSVCSFKLVNALVRRLQAPQGADSKAWKLRNIVTSLVHSSVSGTWAVLWCVLLHHSLVISCFSLAVSSRLYVGFAVLSLLVEINTVFLHTRQLLLLASRRAVAYRVTSLLNLATFLVFRVFTLGWMTHWLDGHKDQLPPFVLALGTVAGITVMNAVLLYRLLRADVLTDKRTPGSDH
ncbi:hypothetical protein NHX12_010684 [Muraenolepis orangiensis]|uniref:TLC domain-containing protein n=1 Tax=Muraenolepis orangiensis TaxID=630683 RepID=A0A9Q0I9L1_9TELE|nr:hypothetical protein NHX12_010684 [Muraenolepis orangiensis]